MAILCHSLSSPGEGQGYTVTDLTAVVWLYRCRVHPRKEHWGQVTEPYPPQSGVAAAVLGAPLLVHLHLEGHQSHMVHPNQYHSLPPPKHKWKTIWNSIF